MSDVDQEALPKLNKLRPGSMLRLPWNFFGMMRSFLLLLATVSVGVLLVLYTGNMRTLSRSPLYHKNTPHHTQATETNAEFPTQTDDTDMFTNDVPLLFARSIKFTVKVGNISQVIVYRKREKEQMPKLASHLKRNFATVPQKFEVEYKNPCWFVPYPLADNPYKKNYYNKYSLMFQMNFKKLNNSFYNHILQKGGGMLRLRCVPYFYIVGQPKCGTTDIYRRLMMHPDVRFGIMKEPHWWTRKRFGITKQFSSSHSKHNVSFKDYLDIFDLATHEVQGSDNSNLIIGEASASTLWDNDAATLLFQNTSKREPAFLISDVMHAVQPDARLIVMLRNPNERLFSDYLYFGHNNKSVEDFHKKTEESINMFLNCTSDYSLRVCIYDYKLSIDMSVRLRIGLYVVFLLDWLSTFPQEQMIVLCLEDFSKNPVVFIRKITNFLQLGPVDEMTLYAMISARPANSRKPHAKTLGDMLPETKKMLNEFYTPFNQKLAQLFNDDSFNW
uniref:carbohydrate sulfotransferase 15 n=1 Tax=Myxine glutinosa TaxID=7769 RepID=UPI00358F2E9D